MRRSKTSAMTSTSRTFALWQAHRQANLSKRAHLIAGVLMLLQLSAVVSTPFTVWLRRKAVAQVDNTQLWEWGIRDPGNSHGFILPASIPQRPAANLQITFSQQASAAIDFPVLSLCLSLIWGSVCSNHSLNLRYASDPRRKPSLRFGFAKYRAYIPC